MSDLRSQKSSREKYPLFRSILLIALACLVFGVQQGVHDNYGIMMNGLLGPTGLDYTTISFCIGVGALIYGFAQPLMGMLAIRTSQTFVLLLGIGLMVSGLCLTPLCRSFFTLLLCFGIILPLGTTGLAFGILMSAITPLIGEKRAAAASGLVQAAAGIGDAQVDGTRVCGLLQLQYPPEPDGIRRSIDVFIFLRLSGRMP